MSCPARAGVTRSIPDRITDIETMTVASERRRVECMPHVMW